MANNAAAAKARRKLKAQGARRLGPITITDPQAWAEILHDENVLPFWREGKDLTDNQLRDATERLITEWCQERRRGKAEEMLQQCASIRTGAIEREPPPDPKEPPALFSGGFSAGGHWSYRPGQKTDRGRKFTEEEIEELLNERSDLQEEFTEAQVCQRGVSRIHAAGVGVRQDWQE
jgi:hypothetical protein